MPFAYLLVFVSQLDALLVEKGIKNNFFLEFFCTFFCNEKVVKAH